MVFAILASVKGVLKGHRREGGSEEYGVTLLPPNTRFAAGEAGLVSGHLVNNNPDVASLEGAVVWDLGKGEAILVVNLGGEANTVGDSIDDSLLVGSRLGSDLCSDSGSDSHLIVR